MNNVDMLYRIFYTVFSMSCMALVLLPAVLVLRFLFRGLSKKFRLALWAILFFRNYMMQGTKDGVIPTL